MSEQSFQLKGKTVNLDKNSLKKITQLVHCLNQHDPEDQESLKNIEQEVTQITGTAINLSNSGQSWDFAGELSEEQIFIDVIAGMSVQVDFFEKLIELFLAAGLRNFKATFFESSAGGSMSWQYEDGECMNDEISIEDKYIVFTGKMEEGSREEMEELAETYDAIAQRQVNSRTDILVTGKNVGKKKIEKAKALNVKIITEEEFMEMIEFCPILM